VYNIVYNHLLAMLVKPGSPKDLKMIEQLRLKYKNRTHRKNVSKTLDAMDLAEEKRVRDDRFEGLSSEVKKLLRYRSKTVG